MTTPNRLTIRLGPLAGPLAEECERRDATPAALARAALAALLGVDAPDMPVGNPTMSGNAKLGRKASRKRWSKRRA